MENVDKALALKPDYFEAVIYKGLLYRVKAGATEQNPRLRRSSWRRRRTCRSRASSSRSRRRKSRRRRHAGRERGPVAPVASPAEARSSISAPAPDHPGPFLRSRPQLRPGPARGRRASPRDGRASSADAGGGCSCSCPALLLAAARRRRPRPRHGIPHPARHLVRADPDRWPRCVARSATRPAGRAGRADRGCATGGLRPCGARPWPPAGEMLAAWADPSDQVRGWIDLTGSPQPRQARRGMAPARRDALPRRLVPPLHRVAPPAAGLARGRGAAGASGRPRAPPLARPRRRHRA